MFDGKNPNIGFDTKEKEAKFKAPGVVVSGQKNGSNGEIDNKVGLGMDFAFQVGFGIEFEFFIGKERKNSVAPKKSIRMQVRQRELERRKKGKL